MRVTRVPEGRGRASNEPARAVEVVPLSTAKPEDATAGGPDRRTPDRRTGDEGAATDEPRFRAVSAARGGPLVLTVGGVSCDLRPTATSGGVFCTMKAGAVGPWKARPSTRVAGTYPPRAKAPEGRVLQPRGWPLARTGRPPLSQKRLTGRLFQPSGHQPTYPGETAHWTQAADQPFEGIQNHAPAGVRPQRP